MYAVIETGGKQYRVQPGSILRTEKLSAEAQTPYVFEKVLLFRNPKEAKPLEVGTPYLENIRIEGIMLAQGRGEKIIVFKKKRRKQYRRKQGHRQNYTDILITAFKNKQEDLLVLSEQEKDKVLKSYFSSLTPKGGKPHSKTSIQPTTLETKESLKDGT